MWLRLVEKMLRRLVGQHFCIIPRHKEGVLRGREFADVDFRDHEVVDKKHKLIVEKGKYKFIPRPSWLQAHPPDTSTQAIVDNSMESFDHFWKTDQLVADYLVEARQDFYREVLAESGPYLHGVRRRHWLRAGLCAEGTRVLRNSQTPVWAGFLFVVDQALS